MPYELTARWPNLQVPKILLFQTYLLVLLIRRLDTSRSFIRFNGARHLLDKPAPESESPHFCLPHRLPPSHPVRYDKYLRSAYDLCKSFAELWGYNGTRETLPSSPCHQGTRQMNWWVTAARRPAATSCSPGTTSARGELRPELLCRTFGLFSAPWILSATLCHQCILLKHPLAQRRSG